MAEEKDPLKGVEIRTMQKDILRAREAGGRERGEEERLARERLAKEETERRRVEEERKKAEEEMRKAREGVIREEAVVGEEKVIDEEKERAEAITRGEEALKRFEEERQLDEVRKAVAEKKRKLEEIGRKEEELQKIREAERRKEEEGIKLEEEKAELEKELQKLLDKKGPLELERNQFVGRENKLKENVEQILEKEAEVEREQKSIEEKERLAKTPEEKKALETQRWDIEEKRRKIERERWDWEGEINKIKEQARGVETKYQDIIEQENKLKERLKEVDRLLKKEEATIKTEVTKKGRPEVKEVEEEGAEKPKREEFVPEINQAEREEQERHREIERLMKEAGEKRKLEEAQRMEVRPERPEGEVAGPERVAEPERIEEELPKLGREKIGAGGTQPSFLAEEELREPETKKSEIKKRLAEIQTREEEERKKFLERIQEERERKGEVVKPREVFEAPPPAEPTEPVEIFRPLPQRPSWFGRFWTRLLAFLLVLSVLAGVSLLIYWFFFVRQPPLPPTKWCESEQRDILESEWISERCTPPPVVVPEIPIPPALISVDNILTFEINEPSEINIYLSQALQKTPETSAQDKITRIIIKDLQKKQVPGLEDFLTLFQAKTPEGFYQKLNKDFNLFIYAQKEGNRLGLITKIEDKTGLIEMLRLWEDTMETDLTKLFAFLGKDKPAVKDYFARTEYRGASIRCQTYTLEDFGSCYSIVGDYFIFTSSLASMKKTIDRVH